MQYVISFVVSRIPLLAISFVTILILYKLYVKIRSNFNVTVNCWFCNQNTKVPYLEANSFTCPNCEQYNGFTKDGDYNKEIYQQLDCSNLMSSRKDDQHGDLMDLSEHFPSNGFCHICNEGQRLKVEKLAQFEPKNESKFDEELEVYKNQLEEQYRLCTTCDRHLKRVLREKKKMVLGSKFLDFIIKGAETFRKPHFARVKKAQKEKLKRKLSLFLAFIAVIHAFCVIKSLPDLTKDSLTSILGDKIGHYTFLMISHVLALTKVLAAYSEVLSNHETIQKLGLFLKTIVMMILYSMGMKLPQVAALNMPSMLTIVSPFLMLVLAFCHNIVDGFKLSRFTFMLTLWSMCAGGLLDYEVLISSKDLITLAASGLTIYLSLTTKSDICVEENENKHSSFHKIYSESCLSDEDTRETLSLLSQKLNSSDNSVISASSSNRSFTSQPRTSPVSGRRMVRSPITSSVMSLNGSQRSPTFKSFCQDGDQTVTRNRSYAASLSSFPTNRSLLDLNTEPVFNRPLSNFGANTSFNGTLPANGTVRSFNKHSDESLQKSKHNSSMYTNAPLASPFSVSSNAVYQRSNLLTPSRFSTNSLATNNPSASWLSGGYFNSARSGPAHQQPVVEKCNFFLEHRNGMNTIPENISRASSHSSGFESQSSATLRDNSTCPEQEQHVQVTTPVSECPNGFYPIDNASPFPRPPSLLSNSFQTPLPSPNFPLPNQTAATQPLSVNCNQDYWNPAKSHQAQYSFSNAFNLRKINEELPPIQRGALLKKWKESHALS